MKHRLQDDLRLAMKARDRTTSAALRSVLAAIGNAEAVDAQVDSAQAVGSQHVAGAVSGLGAAERARRVLSDGQIVAIIEDELRQHLDAAARARAIGDPDLASEHAGRARALARYVDEPR